MEDSIRSSLFKTLDRGVDGLMSGGEGTSGQHLDLLRVSDCCLCVDNLLSGFLEFSSEVPELQHFAFDEGISKLLYGAVDDGLIGLSGFEDALPERIEGRLRTVARSSP